MDMNPYAPPELENSAHDLQANDQLIQLTRWECFLRTLPCSVAGGLLSGIVWGSGVMTFRLSASQAYSLIGGLLGLSVLSSLFTVGAFRGLTFRGQFVRSVVVLSGSCLAVLMIPLLSFCIRATGWHLVGTRTPWLWAISMYLPVVACAALICVTLRLAGFLVWRWTVRIFAFALLIAVVCNGSIDPLCGSATRISTFQGCDCGTPA